MKRSALLPKLPAELRDQLFDEFAELNRNYVEGRWRSVGLNAGRFCEVAYTIVSCSENYEYPASASKPNNFNAACKALENKTGLPRSFRFMIPNVLSTLHELRNQRDIGHVSGEIDPSFMDGSFAIQNIKWVLAELIRVLHQVEPTLAKSVVDQLSQYSAPAVWVNDSVKRVLLTGISLDNKILLLLASSGGQAHRAELYDWLDDIAKSTFNKRIAALHSRRMIEAKAFGSSVQLLPPGNEAIAEIHATVSLAA